MRIDKIYFDMDGVLADFNRGIVELCHREPIDQETASEEADTELFDAIRSVGHFYRKLKIVPGMKELLEELSEQYNGKCEILSSIPRKSRHIDDAAEDKIAWAKEKLPIPFAQKDHPSPINLVQRIEGNVEDEQTSADRVPVHMGKKTDYCENVEQKERQGLILIDDDENNVKAWNAVGGTGIHFKGVEDLREQLRKMEVMCNLNCP